jgi:hypothetical protein
MQITYSLEDRIIDGTAESTLPEMVNMKNTNKEKTDIAREPTELKIRPSRNARTIHEILTGREGQAFGSDQQTHGDR